MLQEAIDLDLQSFEDRMQGEHLRPLWRLSPARTQLLHCQPCNIACMRTGSGVKGNGCSSCKRRSSMRPAT